MQKNMSDDEAQHSGSGEEGEKKETKGKITQRHKVELRVSNKISIFTSHLTRSSSVGIQKNTRENDTTNSKKGQESQS